MLKIQPHTRARTHIHTHTQSYGVITYAKWSLIFAAGSALVQSTFHPHKGWVSAVEWSPCHEHQLASGSYDHSIRVWDIRRYSYYSS